MQVITKKKLIDKISSGNLKGLPLNLVNKMLNEAYNQFIENTTKKMSEDIAKKIDKQILIEILKSTK